MQQLVRRLPGVVSTWVGSASFAPDFYESAKQAAAALPESDTSLAAERLRGIALSHRDWLMADGGTRLRAQWRELFKTFDAVICAVMPTPAYPHDHSPEREKRRIDGKEYVYPDQLAGARNRDIARLAVNRDSDRLRAGRTAGRRADRRALAGGPDAAEAGRTDRARIRRFRSTKDV